MKKGLNIYLEEGFKERVEAATGMKISPLTTRLLTAYLEGRIKPEALFPSPNPAAPSPDLGHEAAKDTAHLVGTKGNRHRKKGARK